MSKLSKEELIQILRSAGKLPGLRGWHKETVEQLVALIKKPEVTEEWTWKAIEYIKEYPSYHRLEEKLKEAGVEVVKTASK